MGRKQMLRSELSSAHSKDRMPNSSPRTLKHSPGLTAQRETDSGTADGNRLPALYQRLVIFLMAGSIVSGTGR